MDTNIQPADPAALIIGNVVAVVSPTGAETHAPHDRHRDRRAVHQGALVAGRRLPTVVCRQSSSVTAGVRPNRTVPIDGVTDVELASPVTARYWSRPGGGAPMPVIPDTYGPRVGDRVEATMQDVRPGAEVFG